MKRILLIAFHFPPFAGSSGGQRTLSLCKYLPKNGWLPIVLTANEMAYRNLDHQQMKGLPDDIKICRCFSLDTTRHLAVKGKYLKLLALPDNWSTWYLPGLVTGLRLIKKYKPSVIWSTYPIATAHFIGASLNCITKVPWIADFRDPMVEYNKTLNLVAPADKKLRSCRLFIERYASEHAITNVFTAEGAQKIFKDRYDCKNDRVAIIPNGFDESCFLEVESIAPHRTHKSKIRIIHSGSLYPTPDRNPKEFFKAVRELIQEKRLKPDTIEIVLRSTGVDDYYRQLIDENGLDKLILLGSRKGYKKALKEMIEADGLLLIQGVTSNPAIPAKLYEYIRAKRPILTLADKDGETAKLVKKLNIGEIAPLDSKDMIKKAFINFIETIESQNYKKLDNSIIQTFSREHAVFDYVKIFNEAIKRELKEEIKDI